MIERISLDMPFIQRHELNLSEAVVFACVFDASLPNLWNFKLCSNHWLAEQLPAVTDKRDTMFRHVTALANAGVIDRCHKKGNQMLRITSPGWEWRAGRCRYRVNEGGEIVTPASLSGVSAMVDNAEPDTLSRIENTLDLGSTPDNEHTIDLKLRVSVEVL